MKSVRPSLRLVLAVVAMAVLPPSAPAHEDDLPEAGHSFHGEAFDEGPRQSAYLMDGMPSIHFPVTTTNAMAQRFFNQGVGQLHGFWYFEAERSFRQVAFLDTNCVMALWGMAMANTSNEKRAVDFMERAVERTNSMSLTRRELLYIQSLAKFHGIKPKAPATDEASKEKEKEKEKAKDSSKTEAKGEAKPAKTTPGKLSDDDEKKRHPEYIKSLDAIVEEFPDDIEAKAFLVFKLWENQGRARVPSHMPTEALCREIFSVNPLHPIHHGRIHYWNGDVDRRALEAAARCGQGSPGIAHMWHMPGHTYSALHRYADGAWQQEASARVDHAYMIRNGVLPDQIHNFAHNNDWLVKNLNYLGRVPDAIDLAKNMIELPRHPKYNNLSRLSLTNAEASPTDSAYKASSRRQNSALFGRTRLIETLVQWELWDDLIALGNTMYLDSTDLPGEQSRRHWALGLAHFAQGNLEEGNAQLEALDEVLKTHRSIRAEDVDAAEAKARGDKQPLDQVNKAMADAVQSHSDRIQSTHRAIEELRLYQALARDETDVAKELAAEAKGIPKERLAQVWFHLADREKSLKLAKEAVDGATNQVQVLANYADLLHRCQKTNEARQAFEQLRSLSPQAALDVPVMKRLQPLAGQLQLSDDWRPPFQPATDVGVRPSLDSLGPFRWHPSPAPDWELADSDGRRISLKSYKGKPVVLIFYLGYGCKHCLEQLNAFSPMARKFEEAGVSLLAVSTDSVDGLKKTFAQSKESDGFPFPIVSNETMDVFKQYRAFDDFENMPLHGTYLIDGHGLIRWQDISYEPFLHTGFLLDEARRLLKLPAKPVLVTSTQPEPATGPAGGGLVAKP